MSHRPDRHRGLQARFLTALLLALGCLHVAVAPLRAAEPGAIVVLTASGEVDGLLADQLRDGIAAAAEASAAAVVIRLDTPGGSLAATQEIVGTLLDAPLPTIVWVAPAGGFAASAGTFITLAANLSFMAPGTRIGAASPIDSSGNDIPGTLGDKIRNDTIAFARSIAQERNRPADWAAATVSESRSSSAADAVALGVVDGMAATIQEVVAGASGRTVQVAGRAVTLNLAGAPIVDAVTNPLGGVIRLLSDPNVAFLLFTAGLLALLFEVQSPNLLTGIFGVVSITLAAVGFVNLPTDVTGLMLVAIGLILLALEPAIPSHGVLTVVGVGAFVLGGSALYSQADRFGPSVQVALPLLAIAAVSAAGLGLLITATALRTRGMANPADVQPGSAPVGTVGQVRRPLEPIGSLYAAGEEWSARAADGRSLPRGATVRVVGSDGLTALVEPEPSG
ncbi:MAG: nodulation protein NfeD [Chloroflexi bacterium]|nr:nodulation protein NfeD [Chloroflexota bacterium]